MAQIFPLTNYYICPQHEEWLQEFSAASGDARQTLINQFVRGWLKLNRPYFEDLARLDIVKRGMDTDEGVNEWERIVITQGFDKLPPYVDEIVSGEISTNPIAHIILPGEMIKKDINDLTLTKENLILLRTAIHYDGSKIIQYISKIVFEHLQRMWNKHYAPQIAAEKSNDWLRSK